MLQTLISFIIAIAVLIAIHEFGHFWVARKCGVKVLRFSLGFGTPIWRHQKSPEDTEFVISALPLGGYVRMVDEREGKVEKSDLPYAFNRQSLLKRTAIVAAGPLFNLGFAVFLYWLIFFVGETGMRPVVGPVEEGTIAEQARLEAGDEIISVEGVETPTWDLAIGQLFASILNKDEVEVTIAKADGTRTARYLEVPDNLANDPDSITERLGIKPWQPQVEPILDEIVPGSPAAAAGLIHGDKILLADEIPIADWADWVEIVKSKPSTKIDVLIEREGVSKRIFITPEPIDVSGRVIGRIGASVQIDQALFEAMRTEYSLGFFPALSAAMDKTWDYSVLTLKMLGKMLIGEASIKNLSGPISIAKYAGASAEIGLFQFLKFLAIVSVSLGVLNLLPIPVLDGGHLFYFLIEAIKGSPVSEATMEVGQRLGMAILLLLMSVAIFQDIQRVFG